ncbi:MAG: M91 family zinc metallopeptidase [Polyangiales bacterium]
MSQPAARLGDQAAHGGVIAVGAPTVLIGSKPAARVGDMHVCPMMNGPVPHVGGPVVLGSFTVLSGGAPQARQGDMAVCVGPPDTVAMGEPTVLVGMAGGGGGGAGAVMAAILGAVVSGVRNAMGENPRAVLLPDGSWETRFGTAITIKGTPEFQAKTVRDLNTIKGTKSGRTLLRSLDRSGRSVTVQSDGGAGNFARAKGAGASVDAKGERGAGSDVIVGYNPDRTALSAAPGSPYAKAAWAKEPNRPADVGLFHELVHADDMASGRLDTRGGVNTGARAGQKVSRAELRAVGLPPFEEERYSENAYRAERGVVRRDFY